jgi:hypothetical protein
MQLWSRFVQSAQISQDRPQKFLEIDVTGFIASKQIEFEESTCHCWESPVWQRPFKIGTGRKIWMPARRK